MTDLTAEQLEFMRKIIGGEHPFIASNPILMGKLSDAPYYCWEYLEIHYGDNIGFHHIGDDTSVVKFLKKNDLKKIANGSKTMTVISVMSDMIHRHRSYVETLHKDHPLLTGNIPMKDGKVKWSGYSNIHGSRTYKYGDEERKIVEHEYEFHPHYEKVLGTFVDDDVLIMSVGSYIDDNDDERYFHDAKMIIATQELYDHFVKTLQSFGLKVVDNQLTI